MRCHSRKHQIRLVFIPSVQTVCSVHLTKENVSLTYHGDSGRRGWNLGFLSLLWHWVSRFQIVCTINTLSLTKDVIFMQYILFVTKCLTLYNTKAQSSTYALVSKCCECQQWTNVKITFWIAVSPLSTNSKCPSSELIQLTYCCPTECHALSEEHSDP